jgi:hypothetical protein
MRWTVALSVALAFALNGCAATPTDAPSLSIAVQSPVDTAYAWFAAINEHNLPLALAHFAPADTGAMEWTDFDSFSFSDVSCSLVSQTSTTADVGCRFTEHAPSYENIDAGWGISLERQPPGPWLINNYGTG